MIDQEARETVIAYWRERATRALESAHAELVAERFDFAINRAYYACFYVVSALLLKDGHKFTKHSTVRGSLHRNYVREGKLSVEWGRFYDRVFENRQRADYQELVTFEREQVAEFVDLAKRFVAEIETLLLHRTQS